MTSTTIDAGKLDQLVDLYAPTESPESPNLYGEERTRGRLIEENIWASVDAITGREVIQGNQVQATGAYRVTIRYREGLTTRNWFRWKGRRLDITHIRDVEGAGVRLDILCQENEQAAT